MLAFTAGCQSFGDYEPSPTDIYPKDAVALAASCHSIDHQDTSITDPRVFRFDFGRMSGPWNFSGFPLSGVDVRTVSWLDTPAMQYRYEFVDPWQRRCYVDSQWAGSPKALLERFFTRRIIFRQADPIEKGCHLRFLLHELDQTYRQLNESYVTLEVLASLMPSRDGRMLAKRAFYIQKAAPTQNARGGVAATREAIQSLSVAVDEWLTELAQNSPAVVERCSAD